MEYQPLKYKFIPAQQNASTAYTLLLLHGTGGDENDLLPLKSQFGDQVNILSIRGNVSEHGMPRFFRRLAAGVFDVQDLHFRTHELVHFLEETAQELNIDPTRFVALGYSNGANIAGASLIIYPEFLAGAILLRPMLPFAIEDPFETSKAQPVFIASGQADPTVSISEGMDWAEILRQNNFQVQFETVAGGHQLTQQDIILATAWFQQYFKTK